MPKLTMVSGVPTTVWFRGNPVGVDSTSFKWKMLALLKDPTSDQCAGTLWITPKGELRLDNKEGKTHEKMLAAFVVPEGGYSKAVVPYSPENWVTMMGLFAGLTGFIAPTSTMLNDDGSRKEGFGGITFVGTKTAEEIYIDFKASIGGGTVVATGKSVKLEDLTLEQLEAMAAKKRAEAAAPETDPNAEVPPATEPSAFAEPNAEEPPSAPAAEPKVVDEPVHSMEELSKKQKKELEREARKAK